MPLSVSPNLPALLAGWQLGPESPRFGHLDWATRDACPALPPEGDSAQSRNLRGHFCVEQSRGSLEAA
jgi:hypothetical protein